MCIRDRVHRAGPLARDQLGQVRLGDVLVGNRVDGVDRALGCLLYTSDAADERSSVDLGGRRIIKKEKLEYTSTYHGYISHTRH